jgi:hypothetical protein
LITLRGSIRYGWLGKARLNREPASFVLFVPGKPAMKVVAQDGTPLPAEHLISSVNLRVEVQGTELATRSASLKRASTSALAPVLYCLPI